MWGRYRKVLVLEFLSSIFRVIANEEEVSVVLPRLVRLDCASLYTELISRPIDSLFIKAMCSSKISSKCKAKSKYRFVGNIHEGHHANSKTLKNRR